MKDALLQNKKEDTSLLKAGSDVLGKWRKKAKKRGSLCDRFFLKKECYFVIFYSFFKCEKNADRMLMKSLNQVYFFQYLHFKLIQGYQMQALKLPRLC